MIYSLATCYIMLHSYRTWPIYRFTYVFIVIFNSYVSLPEGIHSQRCLDISQVLRAGARGAGSSIQSQGQRCSTEVGGAHFPGGTSRGALLDNRKGPQS